MSEHHCYPTDSPDPPSALVEAPPGLRLSLRGGEQALAAAAAAFGAPLARKMCRAETAIERAVLRLGPDELLLLAPESMAERLIAELQVALSVVPHSMVEISQRQIGYSLCGPDAALVLNSGCPLDLARAGFPVGMCTRTVFHKAEILLWRRTDDMFHIEVSRSFAAYFKKLIALAESDVSSQADPIRRP